MPRFYSPEWVAAFNRAVADLDLSGIDPGASLAASQGRYRVAQVVHGAPEALAGTGQLHIVLEMTDGHLSMRRQDGDTGDTGGTSSPGDDGRANVVVSLSYEDAVALSRGDLDPAGALGAGRIRVRGDLSVLVAGQAVLVAAAGQLAELQAATTY